ncbi:MAG: glycosyltransferase family 39 protein [Kiritimatiellae bacterium]|jgi:hypothetical protein|nr:glycosyltransferase family 39 protein [Kiritimatiellia bacterium]
MLKNTIQRILAIVISKVKYLDAWEHCDKVEQIKSIKLVKITHTLASDIRFWILLCFLIRLIGITHAPLDIEHNWRQTLGTMVTRNFYEIDANILYPRIDVPGDKTGITGMEFPLFNYIGYLISLLFGYQHWYGRLINLTVSSLGLYMFYRLISDHMKDQRLAFYSTIALMFSIWFAYSRKIIPDTFSMSLIIAAAYFGFQYFSVNPRKSILRWTNLLLFGILATVGMLTKMSSAYFLAILAVPVFQFRHKPYRIAAFLITSCICLFITGLWYVYWVPYLTEKYQVHHFYFGTGLADGFRELVPHIPLLWKRFSDTALHDVGFALSLFGLGWAIIKKDRQILIILLLCFPPFVATILKLGFNFAHHNYYIIPYVPIMALLAGLGLSKIKPYCLMLVLMFAMCIEGIQEETKDFHIEKKNMALLSLESDLNDYFKQDMLIAVNGSGSPTAIYFAHRKGWSISNSEMQNKAVIRDLEKRGLRLIVVLNNAFGATPVTLDYQRIIEKDGYTIYRIPRHKK